MGRLWGRRAVEGRAMGRRSRGAVLWGIKGNKRECALVAASSRERRWLEWVQGEGQQAPPWVGGEQSAFAVAANHRRPRTDRNPHGLSMSQRVAALQLSFR